MFSLQNMEFRLILEEHQLKDESFLANKMKFAVADYT